MMMVVITYADEYYDCAGNCLSDVDGDLVCDENEVSGLARFFRYACDCIDDDGSTYANGITIVMMVYRCRW